MRYNLEPESVMGIVQSATREFGYVTEKLGSFRVLRTHSTMFVDVDGDEIERPLKLLADYCSAEPRAGFRVYRTRGGMRYLCTSRLFDPCSVAAQAILLRLGADPAYSLLCHEAGCFAARVTPKPHRCGTMPAGAFATCRFMFHAGHPATLDECSVITDHHDRLAAVGSTMPLA